MDTERPTLVFFLPTGVAVLFKSREITGTSRNQTLSRWLGVEEVKTTENKTHWPNWVTITHRREVSQYLVYGDPDDHVRYSCGRRSYFYLSPLSEYSSWTRPATQTPQSGASPQILYVREEESTIWMVEDT
jgi:hypothetical protein